VSSLLVVKPEPSLLVDELPKGRRSDMHRMGVASSPGVKDWKEEGLLVVRSRAVSIST
jgi:hypothetical protein